MDSGAPGWRSSCSGCPLVKAVAHLTNQGLPGRADQRALWTRRYLGGKPMQADHRAHHVGNTPYAEMRLSPASAAYSLSTSPT